MNAKKCGVEILITTKWNIASGTMLGFKSVGKKHCYFVEKFCSLGTQTIDGCVLKNFV